ncbi:urea transport protein [Grosmannia clavigera kw1407]|uniref:Urea transport protein n=1 Tax=Grosmannia clavigera (strain kw1407 / UAMH 11150) TaxID=655863 RepID=F0XHP3_GROCL|nr:urea transport protein [Grosmannia clavigera kw1407]EFX03000.1 urea transport protein [Grosmannia clavigera kw1407]
MRSSSTEGVANPGLGSGILFSYPQLAVISGVQGVLVYALASALPMFIFAALGPIIRRKCPEGFVLTEWTRQRYGIPATIFLGFVTLATLFLYMMAELSAIGQVVTALTGLDGLPAVIVECIVTTIYTAIGGFHISFVTDNIQGAMVLGLIVIATIAIGAETHIDRSTIAESGLLKGNLLGWQLLYILPVAILTNDFFLSNFWLRTFASRTDRDLWIGISIAAAAILVIATLVGCTGLVAVWSGAWPGAGQDASDADSSTAFFNLLQLLPNWVVGFVLVMSISLSTASFDSLQSAMVSSASNDIFRNRLSSIYIRIAVAIVIVPTVVLALRTPSVLQIYLISDLVSAAIIPVLVVGLSDRCSAWNGTDVVVGGLGGLLAVFAFGAIYYQDAYSGAKLLLLEQGLYEGDWGAFGAFVAAPIGGVLFGLASFLLRMAYLYIRARATGRPFDPVSKGKQAVGTSVVEEPVLDPYVGQPELHDDEESSVRRKGFASSS